MKDAFPSEITPASEGLCSGALSPAISPGQADAVPPWDSAEALVEIQRLVAAGLTTRQIGERWGVSRNAVQKRLERQREKARLGVKRDPLLPDWRSEEACVEVLRLRREGRKPVEIARLFGVSASAVFERLSTLPEDYEPKRRVPVPELVPEWGSEDAGKVVVRLREGGWSQIEIGALFGVTDNAVRKRLRRLAVGGRKSREAASSEEPAGLASRGSDGVNVASSSPGVGSVSEDLPTNPQAPTSAPLSWDSPDIEDELRRLRKAGMPLSEIARRFGVARSTLRERLLRLGIIPAPDSSRREKPSEERDVETAARESSQDQDVVARPPLDMASLIGPSGCRWPMWDNEERPTHVYCDKPALRAKWPGVYCEECRAKAFRRIAVMTEM
jgi:DNA-directed RNA polymerase specialized sigma24 family protein